VNPLKKLIDNHNTSVKPDPAQKHQADKKGRAPSSKKGSS
jgi:hypothetical protein